MITRSQRERREARKERARRWVAEAYPEETLPSEKGFVSLSTFMESHEVPEANLYLRVSSRGQKKTLPLIKEAMLKRLDHLGIRVRNVYGDREPETGKSTNPEERPSLNEAVEDSVSTDTPLIAPVFSRFLRAKCFDLFRFPDARPSAEELDGLVQFARGVPLLPFINPDASPDEEEKFMSDLSQEVSGKKGGRPKKPHVNPPGYREERRQRLKPRALKLRRRGSSYNQIAAELGITKSLAQFWTKDVKKMRV